MPVASRLRVAVEINGDVQAQAIIKEMGRRAMETSPLMAAVAQELFHISAERVKEAPWAPLKDNTVARKVSQEENPEIIRDEWRPIKGRATRVGDKLYLALTLRGATGQILRSTRTTATFGVKSKGNQELFYARFVQNVKGTKRRLLAIPAESAVTIGEMASFWIMEGKIR